MSYMGERWGYVIHRGGIGYVMWRVVMDVGVIWVCRVGSISYMRGGMGGVCYKDGVCCMWGWVGIMGWGCEECVSLLVTIAGA